jgi:hypothetical protein
MSLSVARAAASFFHALRGIPVRPFITPDTLVALSAAVDAELLVKQTEHAWLMEVLQSLTQLSFRALRSLSPTIDNQINTH